MSKLPLVSGRDIVKALKRDGFVVVRQRGSHIRLEKYLPEETLKVTDKLFIQGTVLGGLFVNPVFFLPIHPLPARNPAGRAGFVERAGFRTVTERLKADFPHLVYFY